MRELLALCFLVIAVACTRPVPRVTGFDQEAWQKDKQGCSGSRASQEAALQSGINALRGLSQMQIVELLGKPDQNELYSRNQKFFYYWISGSPSCSGSQPARRLSVRFNAMGYAKEILIE